MTLRAFVSEPALSLSKCGYFIFRSEAVENLFLFLISDLRRQSFAVPQSQSNCNGRNPEVNSECEI